MSNYAIKSLDYYRSSVFFCNFLLVLLTTPAILPGIYFAAGRKIVDKAQVRTSFLFD